MANGTINNPNVLSDNLGIKPGTMASGATLMDARIYKTGRIVCGYLQVSLTATSGNNSICEIKPEACPITIQRFVAFGWVSGDVVGYFTFNTDRTVTFYPKTTGSITPSVTFCYPSAS